MHRTFTICHRAKHYGCPPTPFFKKLILLESPTTYCKILPECVAQVSLTVTYKYIEDWSGFNGKCI